MRVISEEERLDEKPLKLKSKLGIPHVDETVSAKGHFDWKAHPVELP
jgi:hypothetical protein